MSGGVASGGVMSGARHSGRCRCGAVRFGFDAAPSFASYCHCDDCRRATGAPVTAFVGVRASAVTWRGAPPARFANGPVKRWFCATCGSPLGYHDDRVPERSYFYTGAMDRPADYPPTHHAFGGDRLPWFHLADDLPRHETTSVPRPEQAGTA